MIAVTYATTHAAPARRQLAAHLESLADEHSDRYFSGLADAVRLTTIRNAALPQIWN